LHANLRDILDINDSGSLSELNLSKSNLRSEGLSVVSEALKSTSIKQLKIAGNLVTLNQQDRGDMSGVIKFTEDMKDMGSLSTMTFGDNGYKAGDKVEARCKGSTKYYAGKIKSDNRDGTFDVLFDDGDRDRMVPERSIKKLGGSPRGQNLAWITVTTRMTEADFSGAAMGPSGAIILAAWLEHKVQHTGCWFGLTTFLI
jgi:hypothetical protein